MIILIKIYQLITHSLICEGRRIYKLSGFTVDTYKDSYLGVNSYIGVLQYTLHSIARVIPYCALHISIHHCDVRLDMDMESNI